MMVCSGKLCLFRGCNECTGLRCRFVEILVYSVFSPDVPFLGYPGLSEISALR